MSIRVCWGSLYRKTRFSLGLFGTSLLHENAGKIHSGRHQIRPEPKRGLEMLYSRRKLRLLPEDPAEGRLRLSICRRAANRFFKIGMGSSNVAFEKSFLATLVGETCLCGRGTFCLSQGSRGQNEVRS